MIIHEGVVTIRDVTESEPPMKRIGEYTRDFTIESTVSGMSSNGKNLGPWSKAIINKNKNPLAIIQAAIKVTKSKIGYMAKSPISVPEATMIKLTFTTFSTVPDSMHSLNSFSKAIKAFSSTSCSAPTLIWYCKMATTKGNQSKSFISMSCKLTEKTDRFSIFQFLFTNKNWSRALQSKVAKYFAK